MVTERPEKMGNVVLGKPRFRAIGLPSSNLDGGDLA